MMSKRGLAAGRWAAPAAAMTALLAMAAGPAAGSSAPSGPETVAAGRLSAFLAAANARSEAPMREFIEKNFSARDLERMPVEPRLRRLFGFARETAPLRIEKALGPASALVRSQKTGRWYEIRLDLAPDAEHAILGIDIEDSDAGALEPEPTLRSDVELTQAADALLKKTTAAGRFSGVALLARHGKPIFEKAYGVADREKKIANTPSTRFNIGSINKIFTQVAIAQLAFQGRLSLTDPVRKILPDYPSPSPSPSPATDQITILQLVNMSSGLGDFFNERYEEAAPRLWNLSDFLRLFADEPLLFAPGTRRQYSNAGYIVLGLIVEKASGQGYHDYIRDHVFLPAGMRSSGPSERSMKAADLAIGYWRPATRPAQKASLRPNTDSLPARSSSAGGGLSTGADLLAFEQALKSNRLLPANWTAWIYSEKTAPPNSAAPQAGRNGLGIAGGAPGINAALESDGAGDSTVVVLANLDPPAAESTARRLRRWMGAVSGRK